MKKTFTFLAFVVSQQCFSQTLPIQISQYLNQNFERWKYSKLAKSCEQGGAGKSRYFLKFDINNDGIQDYVIKIMEGTNGYIMAFVSNKSEFKPHFLISNSSEEIEDCRLSLKGKKLFIEQCESAAYYCNYKNGKFAKQFISD